MKVDIISRETIKPSSPTPNHLRTYKLSLLDQFTREIYVSLLLFYAPPKKLDSNHISKCLKSSLSKTLTRFYPYAGRIKDGNSIECNDEGVVFFEAQVDKSLSAHVLKQPADFSMLRKFLGDSKEEYRGLPLRVQANFFQCGGLVIGLTMCHELTDASTLGLFISAWSSTCSFSDDTKKFAADFSMSSAFPAMDLASVPQPFNLTEGDFTMKRYVFDAAKIALLKKKAISEGVLQPTRVECVNSLIWKCAVAASRSRLGDDRPSIIMQPVNLRKRIVPPLPENSIGNIFLPAVAEIEDSDGFELQDLIANMKRGVQDASEAAENVYKGDGVVTFACEMARELENLGKREDMDFYVSTSWCKFPFYETDFGWGKPTWVSPGLKLFNNFFILIDSKDGEGIEAWCSLLGEDIALIERNEEFIAFASINPTIPY
ncbi:epi-neemfruitin B 7-O-acetyltransferse L7AT-like [Rutidosis leptorrhynchoides]|uniref:epi-neemfruitin B 7-O-acetyltransferse L7AT-like n=1 Tax=Rutidosis leptorrhynchoides TaxID=125765 RepID=UPI003A98E74B